MGLDNYASRAPDDIMLTPEDERVFAEAGMELCGGMFSGDESSFRGKVYLMLVLEVTDEFLSEEWLPPETVAAMAAKLAACDYDTLSERHDLDERYVPSRGEFRDLQTFFRICAERGLGLIGWA